MRIRFCVRTTDIMVAFGAACTYISPMGQFVFIIFNMLLLAVAITTGAVFFVFFASVIAVAALGIFIYAKISGKLPGGMHVYQFKQRVREEQVTPTTKVIEAEYEEIRK